MKVIFENRIESTIGLEHRHRSQNFIKSEAKVPVSIGTLAPLHRGALH